jgi:hypothetical protein
VVVRKGLRAAIEEVPCMKVVGEAGDDEAALAMIGQLHPDIAVLDIDMPNSTGSAWRASCAGRGSRPASSFFVGLSIFAGWFARRERPRITITLPKSKTDQEGQGREVEIARGSQPENTGSLH